MTELLFLSIYSVLGFLTALHYRKNENSPQRLGLLAMISVVWPLYWLSVIVTTEI